MKKRRMFFGILTTVIIILTIAGCTIPQKSSDRGQGMPCNVQPGEWLPGRDECPGTTSEMQTKCNEFCESHPDCCGRKGGEQRGALIPYPDEKEIALLTRNYPAVIKAINEGPAIYQRGQFKIISDETLDKMKDTGFNTIQVLTIDDCTGDKCVMDESSKSLLLNDIVQAKKKGFAIWLAVEFINGPPGTAIKLPEYSKFKNSFVNFSREIGKLAEEYKVEYVTINNEPDLFLQEQTQWGSVEQINRYVAEIMPLVNSAAKENFRGKMINKITQTKKRPKEVLDASFKNVDIAGVDVGPPIIAGTGFMGVDAYTDEFNEYQYYASLAQQIGVPWMVGEYWQFNYFEDASDYAKQNQTEFAQISFDAYLKVTPKGAGYVWNDFSSFSLPKGEETRLALKDFFSKI